MKLQPIHKGEIILNRNDTENMLNITENLKGMSNMKTPTKQAYDSALETVKRYEERQYKLKHLEKDLSYKLSKFIESKFKINKKTGEVLFSGVNDSTGEIGIGKAICGSSDQFEPVIGKLIAVKKALNENVDEVVALVEPKYDGLTINGLDFAKRGLFISSN